jgi:hypothetical protein
MELAIICMLGTKRPQPVDGQGKSRPWLARLAAMPEVLSVQFMQMLCSNGVKLLRDLAVADECDSKHKQRCANDPQSEKPTSPIHCSANPRPS